MNASVKELVNHALMRVEDDHTQAQVADRLLRVIEYDTEQFNKVVFDAVEYAQVVCTYGDLFTLPTVDASEHDNVTSISSAKKTGFKQSKKGQNKTDQERFRELALAAFAFVKRHIDSYLVDKNSIPNDTLIQERILSVLHQTVIGVTFDDSMDE